MPERTNLAEWQALVDRIASTTVLVVGDVMLDIYLKGDVHRISPEAPVPVLEIEEEEHRLGGAANVAANLTAMGARCALVGVVGDDLSGDELTKRCSVLNIDTSGLVVDPSRPTTTKTRAIARTQQLIRLDREKRIPLAPSLQKTVAEVALQRLEIADAVILEDYDKGVLTPALIQQVREAAARRGLPVIVDPKLENFAHYVGATCITPNVHEAGGGVGRSIRSPEDLVQVGHEILHRLALEYLLITRGAEGMTLFERQEEGRLVVTHIPTVAQEVYDVTGAGDTVVALFTAALAVGASPLMAARLANYAAGCAVRHLGCATVSPGELLTLLAEHAEWDERRLSQVVLNGT